MKWLKKLGNTLYCHPHVTVKSYNSITEYFLYQFLFRERNFLQISNSLLQNQEISVNFLYLGPGLNWPQHWSVILRLHNVSFNRRT